MTQPNFEDAPQGTTHYNPKLGLVYWYKIDDTGEHYWSCLSQAWLRDLNGPQWCRNTLKLICVIVFICFIGGLAIYGNWL